MELLDDAGYPTLTAETAGEALDLAAADKPIAAIVDLNLTGGVSGYEVIFRLRERLGTELGIVVLSGRTATADRTASLAIGADEYIAKPYDADELLASVARAIQRRRDAASR